jgi:hypothetical protein
MKSNKVADLNDIKPMEIYIMEKDSKNFFILNTDTLSVI